MNQTLARLAPWLGARAAKLAGGHGEGEHGPALQVQVLAFDSAEGSRLQPCEFGPGISVAGGAPQARASIEAVSADGRLTTGLWDCTAGVLEIHFDCDELVHIVDGEVTVHWAGGAHALRRGMVAFFPRGAVARWEIGHYVRKLYLHRWPARTLRQRVSSRLVRLAGLSRG